MKRKLIRRQVMALFVLIGIACYAVLVQGGQAEVSAPLSANLQKEYFDKITPIDALNSLDVKGRAPKTGYARAQFGDGWAKNGLCDTRNIILKRDLRNATIDEQCRVQSGTLEDPYTGKVINFQRGEKTSALVQIDHVVALSDAWQKGAQQLSSAERVQLANDPLNLLAVDGPANQAKGDGDAATWLPPNKLFRCQYVARQVAVKKKYRLWITEAEKTAIATILIKCKA